MSSEKQLSYRHLQDQYQPDQYSTVLTGRRGGTIETAYYAGEDNGTYYVALMDHKDRKKIVGYRTITPEALSDEGQARLAELLASDLEPTPERLERKRAWAEAAGDHVVGVVFGEPPFEQVAVSSPEMETEVILKQENIERSIRELDRVLGGRLGFVLRGIGSTEAIRAKLDPNTGDPNFRAEVEAELRRGIDELGGSLKLPERVQKMV